MQAALPDIEAAGGRVIAIGNGNAEMARGFAAEFGVTFPLYTDTSRITYTAAGLKTALGVNARVMKRAMDVMKQGIRQGRTQGHAWQQGGTLVLDAAGRVAYHHADDDAADHAPLEPVLAAVRAARG